MNLKGNNVDEISDRIVSTFLEDAFLNKEKMIERCKVILKAWIKVSDVPKNYDKPTSDYGKLKQNMVRKDIEAQYWRKSLISIIGEEKMKNYYKEMDEILIKNKLK